MGLGEQETYADRSKGSQILGVYSKGKRQCCAVYGFLRNVGKNAWRALGGCVTNRAGDGMLFEMTEENTF